MTDTSAPTSPGWMTPAELADELGCSRGWIIEQFRTGRIPAVKVGRSWRFGPEHRAAWIAASLEGHAAPTAAEPVVPAVAVDGWDRAPGRGRKAS